MAEARSTTASQRGPILILGVICAALIGVGVLLWEQEAARGLDFAPYSTYRSDEEGARAAYETLQKLGLPVERWERDFNRLDESGVMLILDPLPQSFISRRGEYLSSEIGALDNWVRRGNTLVIFSAKQNALIAAFGLRGADQNLFGRNRLLATPALPTQPSLLARGIQQINTEGELGFQFGPPPKKQFPGVEAAEPAPPPITLIPMAEWLTLFEKDGRPHVVMAKRGEGAIVAVSGAYPIGNLGLAQDDDARFLVNLAGLRGPEGVVFFDEFHHRNAQRGFMGYVRSQGMLPFALYLALLVVTIGWAVGVRFGEPKPLVADPRRDSIEYVRALATLYQNAGMPHSALRSAYEEFRRRAATLLGLGNLNDLNEAARRYESRSGRDQSELRAAIVETEAALQREALTEAEALHFCQRLAQLEGRLRPDRDRNGAG